MLTHLQKILFLKFFFVKDTKTQQLLMSLPKQVTDVGGGGLADYQQNFNKDLTISRGYF